MPMNQATHMSDGGGGTTFNQVYDPTVAAGAGAAAGSAVATSSSAIIPFNLQEKIMKNSRLFGAPPAYNEYADPTIYTDYNTGKKFGRVFSETYLTTPTIISLSPCHVKYKPFGDIGGNDSLVELATGGGDANLIQLIQGEKSRDGGGKIYETYSAWNEYICTVNFLCRVMAMNLGIQDKPFPGTSTPYRNFDWGNYNFGGKSISQEANGFGNLFGEIASRLGESVFSDTTYVHFYANGDGTSYNEDISTSTRPSSIESLFNESLISDLSKEVNFVTGGYLSEFITPEINNFMTGQDGESNLAQAIANFGKGYLEGARMVFPDIIDGIKFGKTITVNCRFIAPYGDPECVYLRTLVPLAHILAMGCPTSFNSNMYKFPFITKINCTGWFNSEIAVVSNINVKRGGQSDRSWTLSDLSTEVEVTFDVTPLYTELVLSDTRHPLAAFNNTALSEYLASITALEMKNAKAGELRFEIMKMLMSNRFTDIPANMARSMFDMNILNWARGFFTMK